MHCKLGPQFLAIYGLMGNVIISGFEVQMSTWDFNQSWLMNQASPQKCDELMLLKCFVPRFWRPRGVYHVNPSFVDVFDLDSIKSYMHISICTRTHTHSWALLILIRWWDDFPQRGFPPVEVDYLPGIDRGTLLSRDVGCRKPTGPVGWLGEFWQRKPPTCWENLGNL